MDGIDKSKLHNLKIPAPKTWFLHNPEACEDVRRKKPPLPIQVNDRRQATEVEILFLCLDSPEHEHAFIEQFHVLLFFLRHTSCGKELLHCLTVTLTVGLLRTLHLK